MRASHIILSMLCVNIKVSATDCVLALSICSLYAHCVVYCVHRYKIITEILLGSAKKNESAFVRVCIFEWRGFCLVGCFSWFIIFEADVKYNQMFKGWVCKTSVISYAYLKMCIQGLEHRKLYCIHTVQKWVE